MNKFANRVDRTFLNIANNWLLYLNVLFAVYVGLPFVAPVLMKVGWERPAQAIYTIYRPLCHTFAYRSWFLFGEQAYYPASQFEAFTGQNPYTNEGRFFARQFVGDERMGYKVGYCQRDIAIYGALLIFGIVYATLNHFGKPPKPIHIAIYLLLGIAPIALDGFSQLFSQPPLSYIPLLSVLPLRESTPILRTLTGGLFGLMNGWLAFPYVAESMVEIKADIEKKFAKQGKGKHAGA